MWYPKWVYHYREDLTRENMRKYEQMKDEFENEYLSNPQTEESSFIIRM